MSLTLNREVEIYDTWPVAYVDGSFNARTGVYGYGGFLLHRDKDGNIQKKFFKAITINLKWLPCAMLQVKS